MKFQKGNAGKPKGAKSRTPSREEVVKLLDRTLIDLNERFDQLTTRDKLAILGHFKHLFGTEITDEAVEQFRAVTVNIIRSNEDNN
jgi:hypothetical protein